VISAISKLEGPELPDLSIEKQVAMNNNNTKKIGEGTSFLPLIPPFDKDLSPNT
jgi:hypothetical protein